MVLLVPPAMVDPPIVKQLLYPPTIALTAVVFTPLSGIQILFTKPPPIKWYLEELEPLITFWSPPTIEEHLALHIQFEIPPPIKS